MLPPLPRHPRRRPPIPFRATPAMPAPIRRTVLIAARPAVFALAAWAGVALGQPPTSINSPPAVPAPVYWKQDLFLIPYQGIALPGGAKAESVRLVVSTDRGADWQIICAAKPNVKAFNYRAAGDGEYWFAVRAVDAAGRFWPAASYQPELRVVVDKTSPTIAAATAALRPDGTFQLLSSATDANLNPNSWQWEAQAEGTSDWQLISVAATSSAPNSGCGTWMPPPGFRAATLRATVSDLAGNMATLSVAPTAAPTGETTLAQNSPPGWQPATPLAASPPIASRYDPTTASASEFSETQTWPAGLATRSPYRLYDTSTSPLEATGTRYGNPPRLAASSQHLPLPPIAAASSDPPGSTGAESAVTPEEPFRDVTVRRLPPIHEVNLSIDVPEAVSGSPNQPTAINESDRSIPAQAAGRNVAIQPPPTLRYPETISVPPGIEPKHVSSRTFDLDYHFDDLGRWGISRVELWGTRDGGKSWRRYAEDADLRSPLRVTVDGEGVYGFRIVAQAAGGARWRRRSLATRRKAGSTSTLAVRTPKSLRSSQAGALAPIFCRLTGGPRTNISTLARSPCSTAVDLPAPGPRSRPTFPTRAATSGASTAISRNAVFCDWRSATPPATSAPSKPSIRFPSNSPNPARPSAPFSQSMQLPTLPVMSGISRQRLENCQAGPCDDSMPRDTNYPARGRQSIEPGRNTFPKFTPRLVVSCAAAKYAGRVARTH